MAVPASGQLKLYSDIYTEFTDHSQGNNSLHSASIYAGFTTPDAMSDFYGYQDQVVATVTTCTAASILDTSMQVRGAVNNLGGAPNVIRGFRFGTYSNINSNPQYVNSNSAGTGDYNCTFTSLTGNTTYYYQAYATNDAGTGIGNTCSSATLTPFTCTLSNTPTAHCSIIQNNSEFNTGLTHQANFTSLFLHPFNGWTGLRSCNGDGSNTNNIGSPIMNTSPYVSSPLVCHRIQSSGRQGYGAWSSQYGSYVGGLQVYSNGGCYQNPTSWTVGSNPSTTAFINSQQAVCFCICNPTGYAYNLNAIKYWCHGG